MSDKNKIPGVDIIVDHEAGVIREVKPDDVSVYPLLPYPGTPLYKNPEKYGMGSLLPHIHSLYLSLDKNPQLHNNIS